MWWSVGVVAGEQAGLGDLKLRSQRTHRGRCQQQHPFRAGRQRERAVAAGGWRFEQEVGVDPAEAEGVDRGAAGCAVLGLPGGGSGHGCEAGAGECRMRVLAVQGRWEHPVVGREGGFDQPGDAGGGHGVPDHGFDRADPDAASGAVRGPEDPGQGAELGVVAGGGAGAVGFEQPERTGSGGVPARGAPGPLDGLHLPRTPGAHQAGGAAVAGDAGAPDDRVDPVVTGVGEAFEHDHPGALTDEQPVRATVERPDPLGGAQRTELAEHAPQGDVVAVVHPAGEHHVAAPGGQLGHRVIDSDEG